MGNKRKKKLQTQVGKYLKGPLYFIAFWIMINVIKIGRGACRERV